MSYIVLTLAATGGWLSSSAYVVLPTLIALIALLIRDIATLKNRVVACNIGGYAGRVSVAGCRGARRLPRAI